MRAIRLSTLTATALFLVSCGGDKELTSDEVREITTLDERVVSLNPTSTDRFQGSQQQEVPQPSGHTHGESKSAGGFAYTAGEGWVAKPKTQFRLVNYALPEGGEIYVSITGGGVLPNLNRWLGQFSQEKITGEQLGQQARVNIMGVEGYVVEATGSYAGMGRAKQDDMSLLGALAEVDGQLISVKMISTVEEVAQQKEAFMTFCESLAKE